jgi:hypothetical protein
MAVVGRLLLRTVDGTLGAVDIESHAPGGLVWHQVRFEAGELLIVPLLGKGVRFKPVMRRDERDARLPALAGREHPKRGVLGQPLGVA